MQGFKHKFYNKQFAEKVVKEFCAAHARATEILWENYNIRWQHAVIWFQISQEKWQYFKKIVKRVEQCLESKEYQLIKWVDDLTLVKQCVDHMLANAKNKFKID